MDEFDSAKASRDPEHRHVEVRDLDAEGSATGGDGGTIYAGDAYVSDVWVNEQGSARSLADNTPRTVPDGN
jgi:hypothetical protein